MLGGDGIVHPDLRREVARQAFDHDPERDGGLDEACIPGQERVEASAVGGELLSDPLAI
ncbi:hypothetical protein D3C72_2077620 [compost metagenome]